MDSSDPIASIPLEAFEAMNAEPIMEDLYEVFPNVFLMRQVLDNHANKPVDPRNPDWVAAGLNCKDGRQILSVCQMVYLNDWRQP